MRELVFKNLTSIDKKRRDLYISEVIENNGVKTITKRHSVYIIGKPADMNSQKGLESTSQTVSKSPSKRHVFIFKKHDTKSKKDSFVCDVVGQFYAVCKNGLYPITFKHSFEIDFLGTTKK
ncbi:MAG: hypothetical protein ABH848_03595 [Candidatus Omnitrophota bacterium]